MTASTTNSTKNNRVTTRPVDELEPHEFSTKIFDQDIPNGRFIQSIKEGLEKPLIITESGEVIDGVRRLKAAQVLDWSDIDVEVRSYDDERQRREAILRHNDNREETFSQKVRVALEFEELIAPVMEERMKRGTGVNKSDLNNGDILIRAAQGGKKTTRDLVGDRVGWSGDTYRRAKKIWEAANNGEWREDNETIQLDQELQELAEEVISEIDEGDRSITSGHKNIKRRVARSNGVIWKELRSYKISNELDKIEDEVPETASHWDAGLRKTLNNYQSNCNKEPDDAYLPLIMYLLEQKAGIRTESDSDVVVGDISSRRPDQKRLEELYWDDDRSREEIAVCYGVTVPVINYWLREAGIELKRDDAP